MRTFDEKDFGEKVKEKYYDEEIIQKDEEWMKSDRKFVEGQMGQKYNDGNLRKREAKEKSKVNQDTKQLMNFMSK